MSLLDDPSYWRARATNIRQLAEASADLIYREKLQKLAASYDQVAARALERLGMKLVQR